MAYMEGFLLKDNWEYFNKELSSLSEVGKAKSLLTDIIEISSDSLEEAFSPSLKQWKTAEGKMAAFVDATIKSSAVNAAALTLQKIK
jgi:hypothetical protein